MNLSREMNSTGGAGGIGVGRAVAPTGSAGGMGVKEIT
jgi:hypothetical protein